jgi:predicted Fe-S protein YdhL (DUF1289 family)
VPPGCRAVAVGCQRVPEERAAWHPRPPRQRRA